MARHILALLVILATSSLATSDAAPINARKPPKVWNPLVSGADTPDHARVLVCPRMQLWQFLPLAAPGRLDRVIHTPPRPPPAAPSQCARSPIAKALKKAKCGDIDAQAECNVS